MRNMNELIKRLIENMKLFVFSQRTKETYLYRIEKMIEYIHDLWSRMLDYHPNVHYIVTGSGKSIMEDKWIKFLFPVKVLSAVHLAHRLFFKPGTSACLH